MKKHTRTWSLLLLLATTIATGCSDSMVDATEEPTTLDAYKEAYLDETALVNFSELPTVQEALYTDGDSLCTDSTRGGRGPGRHGGPRDGDSVGARGWHHRGADRGFGPLGFRSYERIVRQLGLSAEQDSMLKVLLAELRSCAQDAAAPYQAARQEAFDSMKAAVGEVRAAVTAGTMTEEQGRAAIETIRAEYHATVDPLNEQVRAAVDVCRTTFESSFAEILTPEQLELWNSLK